jgi:adenosine deaminase
LLAELRTRAIPLEVCPSSNVALGLVRSMADHPLPRLLAAGLTVTLNADIPTSVGTSLSEEYRRVRDTFALDDAAMANLARAAVRASFAATATKNRLADGIDAWLAEP